MHVILTHEQADFDAIASLMGAYLLDDRTHPVLPRRMNRNVRAFLTLYGAELPFIEPSDLSNEIIDKVTLVDTQSLTTLKGMISNTCVHVIDHHELRVDTNPNWKITMAATGANATIFVESLCEQNVHLPMIQATLLLLGIYEDTGSLSYVRTTPRDLKAASYLLEQGANLSIASEFLNHPMSLEQQEIYEQLRKNLTSYDVNGHSVVLAIADAKNVDEELSTIVHKLRDLIDPDALIVLIETRGGIQLIARSNSEDINVAKLTTHFGGGGHDRAAASLIKDMNVESITKRFIELLPEFVQPALKVSQIMSKDPQLLSPVVSAKEAAEKMQRYGHEGFPVVKDDRILGLLTRRAVDRALTHKLDVPVTSLMESGDYSIHPDDSVEFLQKLMTESGWGQVPVRSRETEKIIGIVTRTDVIKALSHPAKKPGHYNLIERLEKILPTDRLILLKILAFIADEKDYALYIVGGFVRDLLLNKPSLDYDLVVEGDAIIIAKEMAKRFGGRVISHSRFGTAKWLLDDEFCKRFENFCKLHPEICVLPRELDTCNIPRSLDLVTARTEFYTYPSALPTVERSSIKLDLHRRDFTINTLALRLDGRHYGELHDYWGGWNDLKHGVVRVLHSLSFVDDPTRILRAVRFEKRFGFKIEKRTLELMLEAVSLLERVSGDRIRHELNSIWIDTHTVEIFSRLCNLDLLEPILPGIYWDEWLIRRIESLKLNKDWQIWLQASKDSFWDQSNIVQTIGYGLLFLRLDTIAASKIISRLKLSARYEKIVGGARDLWKEIFTFETNRISAITKKLDEYSIISIIIVYLALESDQLRMLLENYLGKWMHIKPKITGNDLRKRGIKPGPQYRYILEKINSAWLDGIIQNEEQENSLLEEILAENEDQFE